MALCQQLLSKMHDYRNFPPSQIEDVRYLPTCLICSLLLSYYLQLNESFKDSSSRQNFPNSLHHTTSHLREDGGSASCSKCAAPCHTSAIARPMQHVVVPPPASPSGGARQQNASDRRQRRGNGRVRGRKWLLFRNGRR